MSKCERCDNDNPCRIGVVVRRRMKDQLGKYRQVASTTRSLCDQCTRELVEAVDAFYARFMTASDVPDPTELGLTSDILST